MEEKIEDKKEKVNEEKEDLLGDIDIKFDDEPSSQRNAKKKKKKKKFKLFSKQ